MNRSHKTITDAVKKAGLRHHLEVTQKHVKLYIEGQLVGTFVPGKDGTVFHIINRIKKWRKEHQ